MHNCLNLKSKWKTIKEILSLMNGLLVIEVLNLGHKLSIKLWWNMILLQNTIQNVQLFLVFSISLIIGCNDGSQRTRSKGEENYTYELKKDANDSFRCASE